VDSKQPAERIFGVFCSLYGHYDPIEMDYGFGQIRLRVGFGWIRVDWGGFLDPGIAIRQPRGQVNHARLVIGCQVSMYSMNVGLTSDG